MPVHLALWCRWIVAFSDFFVLPEDPSVGRQCVFEGDVVARITESPTRKSAVVTIERRGSAEDLT